MPSAAPAQTVLRRVRPNAATASHGSLRSRDRGAGRRGSRGAAQRRGGVRGSRRRGQLRTRGIPRVASLAGEGARPDFPAGAAGGPRRLARPRPPILVGERCRRQRPSMSPPTSGKRSTSSRSMRRRRVRRLEIFAPDRLGDAIARLYERYAELLPDGPERTRAAATARSVAVLLGPRRPRSLGDGARARRRVHRSPVRRVARIRARSRSRAARNAAALLEVADGVSNRIDDVLDLRSDAFLVRWTNLGTARAGGGAFERRYLRLFVFGSDGLATRMEWFDADRDAEALARFDELTAAAGAQRASDPRRVRPNAATANAARVDAAIAARDAGALAALFADDVRVGGSPDRRRMDDRRGVLASWRSLLRARGPDVPARAAGDPRRLARAVPLVGVSERSRRRELRRRRLRERGDQS